MLGSSGIAPLDRTIGLKQNLMDIDEINILFVTEKKAEKQVICYNNGKKKIHSYNYNTTI